MPCDQIQLCSLSLQASNRKLLKKALDALGWRVTSETEDTISGTTDEGVRFSITPKAERFDTQSGYEGAVDRLKQQYTREVLKEASRFGWALKGSGNRYVATKRV